MNPLEHIRQQLKHAEKLLIENRIEECFTKCEGIQRLVETLVVDESNACVVARIKEKNSAILRKLNRLMVNSIKLKNQ